MKNDEIESYAKFMSSQKVDEARFAPSDPAAAKRQIELEYAKAQRSIDAYRNAKTSQLEKRHLADALSSINQEIYLLSKQAKN